MSSAARWANTAKATLWPALPRNDWDGSATFGDPVVIDCDYSSEAKVTIDAKGQQFVSALTLFTEYDAGKADDVVALGDHSSSALPVADARPVRKVERYSDVFERKADDYRLIT